MISFARMALAVLLFATLPSTPLVLAQSQGGGSQYGTPKFPKRQTPQLDPSDEAYQEFEQDNQQCNQAAEQAGQQCDSSQNQNAQGAQNQSNQTAQSQGGSGQQNCDQGVNKWLPALLELLKAFQGDCQSGQQACQQACGQAREQAQQKCAKVKDPKKKQACMQNAARTEQFASQRESDCQGLNLNLAGIGAAIATAMQQMQKGKQCQKDTNKNCSDPTMANDPKCKAAFNCNLKEYANDPKCICMLNPRASKDCPGFEEADPSDLADKRRSTSGSSSSSSTGTNSGTSPEEQVAAAVSRSPQLPFFPGGSSPSSTGRGEGNGKVQDGASKPNKPEVLAGEYGGGNGSGIKGGSGYPDSDIRGRGLGRKPAASRAQLRRMAAKDGFTGAHGRSNWQKIHERYRDNRPTLY